jgi:hypothetical protein
MPDNLMDIVKAPLEVWGGGGVGAGVRGERGMGRCSTTSWTSSRRRSMLGVAKLRAETPAGRERAHCAAPAAKARGPCHPARPRPTPRCVSKPPAAAPPPPSTPPPGPPPQQRRRVQGQLLRHPRRPLRAGAAAQPRGAQRARAAGARAGARGAQAWCLPRVSRLPQRHRRALRPPCPRPTAARPHPNPATRHPPKGRDWDLLLTAETHNFPCAVAPYPGGW